MANFLEKLVAEWYQYRGYFVLQNVHVGKRVKGGYDTELDVVAFNPVKKEILHFETSTDSDTWERRETRYRLKFDLGKQHIPKLLSVELNQGFEFRQVAIFVYGSNTNRARVGGGDVMPIHQFMGELKAVLRTKTVAKAAVSEQFPLIRAIQFSLHFGK